jgi:acetylglutamate kinase
VTLPRPLVLKFGGELLEDRAHLATVVSAIARVAAGGAPARTPIVIVHGGGREIDAALKAAGIEKRQVDGLRITDEATLDVVVSVLAGTVNTRLVAALNTASRPSG